MSAADAALADDEAAAGTLIDDEAAEGTALAEVDAAVERCLPMTCPVFLSRVPGTTHALVLLKSITPRSIGGSPKPIGNLMSSCSEQHQQAKVSASVDATTEAQRMVDN